MPYTRTTWVNNSAPDINAANLNNIELGIVAAPYGPDASANFVPVWNGSAWTYSGVKNAHVDAAAAIAYSKLNLATSIVNGDISASAAIAYSKLSLAASLVNADVASGAAIAVSKLAAGTNTQVLTTSGGVPTWAAAAGSTNYRKVTSKVVSTNAETDLLNAEITVGANVVGSTGVVKFVAFGDYIQNSGGAANSPRFKLKLGATTLFDTNVISVTNSATRFGWRVSVEIVNRNATNSQAAYFVLWLETTDAAAAGVAFTTGEGSLDSFNEPGGHGHKFIGSAFNTSAVDTTASQALVLSTTNGSSTTTDTTLYGALVEIV